MSKLPLPLYLASEDANCAVGKDDATRPTTQYGYRSEWFETDKYPISTVSLTGFGKNAIGSTFVSASLLGAIEYVGTLMECGTFLHRCPSRLRRIFIGIHQFPFYSSLLLPLEPLPFPMLLHIKKPDPLSQRIKRINRCFINRINYWNSGGASTGSTAKPRSKPRRAA